MIYALGIGPHHRMQKLAVENALETLNSIQTSSDNDSYVVEGQKGEYALQHTDIIPNSWKGDGLQPNLPPPMDDFDTSNPDTRNLLSADTKGIPTMPAAKKKAPAEKLKAPVKKNEPANGRPTGSRRRNVEAMVDGGGGEERELKKVVQEKVRA
jgi:hypothetical protein